MKHIKMYIVLLLLMFLCTLSNQLKAQGFAVINSMSIIPSPPTTNDPVFLIVNASFSSGPCDQIVQYVTVIGNSIGIQAGHSLGPLAYICTSIDTIPLGQLSVGTYSLIHTINASGATATDSLSFTVTIPTGMGDLNANSFTIYPNPATNFIKILACKEQIIDNVNIINLNGQLIPTNYQISGISGKNEILLDIEHIKNGIYYLQIDTNKKLLFKKLVIQH